MKARWKKSVILRTHFDRIKPAVKHREVMKSLGWEAKVVMVNFAYWVVAKKS